ncbi:Bug family tripartite tricarboxylate transporter substrate binding protein [Xanthobacter tagetidis]|uniref:Tripartite tricarboxylate transporter substrate binding protein n=1 Tax=Xanthobacter tagetidis TaxID=60216 RepID=A0A3L7AB33_9HYPH|nr:tripartite tricarboxylate transporter substrate binding protein [Xanthobacter tagetidis]MBB6309648.1 tripartite-type tricarboxylate transporter receptor subunit TctC [Xanthobacter tagetidis]RLP77195.1 tripartite tricarboxylate transporter substrate binding protein [Xanthobacter tagetidis]
MKRQIAAALAATVLFAGAASAEDYPTRAVTILVPFAPGGIVDIAARVVGERLQQKWGQPVVIENRAGASGMIAAQAAAKAKPDGYTLLGAEAGVSIINELIFKTANYSMEKDFTPILTITDTPIVLVANANAGIGSMKEFLAKAKTTELDYASPATGTLNHLTGEWIAIESGAKIRHIGYKGGAPAATAVAGGEVPLAVLAYSSAKPFVDSGRVKMLAVTDGKRVAVAPDLPTLQESGVPNVSTTQWAGLFAPAGTPQPIIDKIQKDIVEVLALPEVKERLGAVGAAPQPSTSAEFAARLKKEREQFKKIVSEAKVGVN